MGGVTWRVGRKLGRTIYRGNDCVGLVDTPEIAADICVAMNGSESAAEIARVRDSLERAKCWMNSAMRREFEEAEAALEASGVGR